MHKLTSALFLFVCSYFLASNNAIARKAEENYIPLDSKYSYINVEEKEANGYNKYLKKSSNFKKFKKNTKKKGKINFNSSESSANFNTSSSSKSGDKRATSPLLKAGFNTSKKDKEAIRKELENNPNAFLDLYSDVMKAYAPGIHAKYENIFNNPDMDGSNLPESLVTLGKMAYDRSNID